MELWNNIIHTALLGTDRKALKKEELPLGLEDVYDSISQNKDKEEQYLQLASVALNYRKCGNVPFRKTVDVIIAEEETKPYCSAFAQKMINEILSDEVYSLLALWLQECSAKNEIVQPHIIPVLFYLAKKQKHLQKAILTVSGKRGEWLLPLNEEWDFSLIKEDETTWQTGTLEERKIYLQKGRQHDAAKGRELIQEVWTQENANSKAELLKTLSVGLGEEDTEWLESLLTDKSSKVKDEAMKLLKRLPDSSLVQKYWNIVKRSVHIKKEKGLLGIGTKTTLDIQLVPDIEESIFKSGIEKISSQKKESDENFILHQLISSVPPSFFEPHFALTKEAILDLFLQSKKGKPLFSAFGLAAARFKDLDWTKAIIAKADHQFYPEALELLPDAEKDAYALRFIGDNNAADIIISHLQTHSQQPWSVALTKEVFRHTAKNHYRYNSSFYKENVLHFPVDIIRELEKCTPPNEYDRNQWSKMSDYIIQLLTLRTQIIQAFQS